MYTVLYLGAIFIGLYFCGPFLGDYWVDSVIGILALQLHCYCCFHLS